MTGNSDRSREEPGIPPDDIMLENELHREIDTRPLLDAVPDIVYLLDADGRILYINQAVTRYGFVPGDLIGTSILDLVHPGDRTNAQWRVNERRTGDRSTHNFELRVIPRNGIAVPLEIHDAAYRVDEPFLTVDAYGFWSDDDSGRKVFSGTVGVARDITERKLVMTELLDARERAEAASRAKSEFLATVSHELRTPLNGVIGPARMLGDPYWGELTEKQRRLVETIAQSGTRLLEVINDILDFSSCDSGRRDVFEKISVGDMLGEIVGTLSGDILQKKILFRSEGCSGFAMTTHPYRFERILRNLVENAVKFTEDGGEVTVITRAVPEGVEVSVRDNGIGIRDEDRDRIFTPFGQLNGAYSKTRKGMGMGLAVARKFTESLGGRIWFESVHGKGSTFSFFLPDESGR